MKQYLELGKRIIEEGTWVTNERTGKKCLTIINADLTYDVGAGEFPLVTTRKCFAKTAIMEIIGYLRGYSNANEFSTIGCNTWLANANENQAWLNNPARNGDGDMGLAYRFRNLSLGVWVTQSDKVSKCFDVDVDQFADIIDKLKKGIDDRGLIMTAWIPHTFDYACLRPCMYSHHFSLLGDTLYLNSTQRSCDVPLGLTFNMVQCYFLLAIVARITGYKPGKVYHKIVNAHLYEDQVELFKEQMTREPFESPQLVISDRLQTLEDLLVYASKDDFQVVNYKHYEAINYPFSV